MRTIGVFAPSAVTPKVELALGAEKLRAAGFDVRVHPFCGKRHRFLAGTDRERAAAFAELAFDPEIDILWVSRGGYGAARTLREFEKICGAKKPPRGKLLVGYSDTLILSHHAMKNWGWRALHASMPGGREFLTLTPKEYRMLLGLVRGDAGAKSEWSFDLKWLSGRLKNAIHAPLMGGNLASWAALAGTKYSPQARGKIVFFEDVTESLYRLDRMAQQLLVSGALDGAKAIVLGNFLDCKDSVARVLAKKPREGEALRFEPQDLKPLRPRIAEKRGVYDAFLDVARELGIPLAYGLPCGHGPEHFPLPLGGEYTLEPSGRFELRRW